MASTALPVRSRPAPPPPAPAAPAAPAPAGADGGRDVALDLLRGLAMVILVTNHIHLETPLEVATRALLSAAEVLVMVSGVVAGMVFGRRWLARGRRETTLVLLRRARTLYLASVVVVSLVGVLTLVPWLATDVLAFSPRAPERDLYGFDGPGRMLVAILTLEAGPWQFNILGYFIAMLAITPALLWLLERGRWPLVVAGSLALYLAARRWDLDVLPSQSERPFPLLIWQTLFVGGLVIGWHRDAIVHAARTRLRWLPWAVLAAGAGFAALRLAGPGGAWERAWFDKGTMDPLRLLAMASMTAAVYLTLRRFRAPAERWLGPVLLPLGRNSFYVFIMHVFVCLTVASVPVLAGDGVGTAGNIAVQAACLAGLVLMVRRRVLFGWVPR